MGLALFLAAKVIGGLSKPESDSKTTVKGEAKKESLDLSDDDIVDVDFKEVKE
jgi:hypothetical protein